MNHQEIIQSNINMANFILSRFLEDLTTEDLCIRSVPGANTVAWQLGHLISSTSGFLKFLDPENNPALPEGFEARHAKNNANLDDPKNFDKKEVYLDLFAKQAAALKKVISGVSESDLDKPGPESIRSYAPTVGAILMLSGSHILMHVGQIAVLRRKLGKPIVM